MKQLRTVDELKHERDIYRGFGRTIGFVPTMGYLHEGHLSLVRQSRLENDVTIVSIFVNPTQFGPKEDFGNYPRNLERDLSLLAEVGVDIVFIPDREQLYPPPYRTFVQVEELDQQLCGKSRPGHFRGVATIVLKLFNIVHPNRAYFGSKDAQQVIIIKKMARDLDLDTHVCALPIIRDVDGLALSSRNTYLSPEERQAALSFPRALVSSKEAIKNGWHHVDKIIQLIQSEIAKNPAITIDYIEVVSLDQLEHREQIDLQNTLVAGAVWVGKTRLIDNFILGEI